MPMSELKFEQDDLFNHMLGRSYGNGMSWKISTVETVLGPEVIEELGRILPHEHLCSDLAAAEEKIMPQPNHLIGVNMKSMNITLETLGYIREYPYSNESNLKLNDEPSKVALMEDLKLFRSFGGRTIMENSGYGFGKRDVAEMRRLSRATGVKIILGTGYHLQLSSTAETTREEIYNMFYNDIVEGISLDNNIQVKAGFLGQISSSVWPMSPLEKCKLAAAGEIQDQFKCVATFAPGNDKNLPYEMLRYYQEAGGNEKKVLMLHTDRIFKSAKEFEEYAERSRCYLALDKFGNNSFCHQFKPNKCMLTDAERITRLLKAKSIKTNPRLHTKEVLPRILLSHDIHTKNQLKAFGGVGFSHIYANIVPVLDSLGFTKKEIDMLTIENAHQWLRS